MVSTNTPRFPPIAIVQSPPDYAQPCCGVHFIPLNWEKAPAKVLNIMVTVAQNWAVIAAIYCDLSMVAF